jgi:FkbM family methyltransferase
VLDTVVLTLVDGVRVAVPDSLFLITPYVLREQQDFFEDELPFVRQLLQPGQNVVDIGANYGVYTLPMAQKIGASGHLWAFEPSSSTAQFLARGIAENGFGHVTLEQKALSRASGTARLALHVQAELRSIVHDSTAPPEGTEEVSLTTLDDCMDRFHWENIELIKIDAEGEEANIVEGGHRFFATLAPLVQYELKSATDANLDLIRHFATIGYDSYRLLPSLNALVPLTAGFSPDPYLLNLFCCKASRADQLAARGMLLRSADLARADDTADTNADREEWRARYHWQQALAQLPYAASLAPVWELTERSGAGNGVHQALSYYASSRDASLPLVERFRALGASYFQLKALCEREPVRLRLASLARVANDYGERAVAVKALSRLMESIRQTREVDPNEPFLAPLERFDWIDPGQNLGNWIIGSVLEQLERRERYSSFYAGPSALERLQTIQALGFGSAEMGRRLDLVRRCIAQATAAKGQRSTTLGQ